MIYLDLQTFSIFFPMLRYFISSEMCLITKCPIDSGFIFVGLYRIKYATNRLKYEVLLFFLSLPQTFDKQYQKINSNHLACSINPYPCLNTTLIN